jgi:hypothetical protein
MTETIASEGWDFDATIFGEPASAKNQRRIVSIGGKPRLIKSAKALAYCKTFEAQCPKIDLIEEDCIIRLDVWYASRRPDLAAMDLVMDLLQGHVYSNDRQVKGTMSLWNLDRANPRIRVRVSRVCESSVGMSSFKLSEIWPGT